MNEKQLIEWFERIENRFTEVKASKTGENDIWGGLFTEMRAALESVFPPSHAVRRSWEAARVRGESSHLMHGSNHVPERFVKDELFGIFQTAHGLLNRGLAQTLSDGVRAESITHFLDQAEALATAGYSVPAMVLAGGALETHLLNLCERFSLTWTGEGSISKYNNSLGQARNQGTQQIVTSSDSGSISSWGADRNDAAHKPASFTKKANEVLLAIEGIRQFLSRTQ